jgi:hypothetical protein
MFNPIVETAIGLIFIYLLLSMLCSAIQEWIAALFALRAKNLEEGLRNMLANNHTLVQQIYDHPLVKGLSRRSWWNKLWGMDPLPSYISAEIFAKALLQRAGVTLAGGNAPQLPAAGGALPNDVRDLLQTLITYAPGDVDKLRANVEQWYNDAMDRVSGWYKRKTQKIILVIAAILSLAFNADTIMLGNAFWHDPTLRAAAVSAATDYVKTHQAQQQAKQQEAISKTHESTTPSTNPAPAPPPEKASNITDATQNLEDTFASVQGQLGKINVPLGWRCRECSGNAENNNQTAVDCKENDPSKANWPRCVWGQKPLWSLWKILGLLITTLAISQGAPFWFDLLQKAVNLRLAGDAPDEKPKNN